MFRGVRIVLPFLLVDIVGNTCEQLLHVTVDVYFGGYFFFNMAILLLHFPAYCLCFTACFAV